MHRLETPVFLDHSESNTGVKATWVILCGLFCVYLKVHHRFIAPELIKLKITMKSRGTKKTRSN